MKKKIDTLAKKELRILNAINRITNSTENFNVLISKIFKVMREELKVRLIFLSVKRDGSHQIFPDYKLNPKFKNLLIRLINDTLMKVSPILIRKSKEGTLLRNFGIKSSISVPLMTYTGPIGVIILMAKYKTLSDFIVRIVNSIAVQVAFAIQHIWLKEEYEKKEKRITSLYNKLYSKKAKEAILDSLTGLYNRRYFVELLKRELKKRKIISLIMFDLDFFKNYNDNYGHIEGDKLLKAIGKILKRLDKKIKSCRYGGEEFVITGNLRKEEAVKLAEKIRKEIENLYPKNAKRVITASFGVGQHRGETFKEFIKRVDSALYKAKELGRNIVIET